MMERVAPDTKRCDAIATDTDSRCRKFATWFRDGRQVCTSHFRRDEIEYAAESFDRVGAYAATMARALGDDGDAALLAKQIEMKKAAAADHAIGEIIKTLAALAKASDGLTDIAEEQASALIGEITKIACALRVKELELESELPL